MTKRSLRKNMMLGVGVLLAGTLLLGVGIVLGRQHGTQREVQVTPSEQGIAAGSIDQAEPQRGFTPENAAAILRPIFAVLDCEQQGFVQQPEIDEHFSQLLSRVDRDRSRIISRDEYARASQQVTDATLQWRYNQIDRDGNGKVSAKEYRDHLYAMHELADLNRDGEVSEQELSAAGP